MVIFRNLVVMFAMLLMSTSTEALAQCRYSIVPIEDETRPLYSWAPRALDIGVDGTLSVNWYSRSIGQQSGLWRHDSPLTILEVPVGASQTTAIGLVDAALVAGHASEFDFQNMRAVLWIAGRAHPLSAPSRFISTYAIDVNRHGLVAGGAYLENIESTLGTERPVMWKNGRFQELETPPDLFGRAVDINDRGIIAGNVSHVVLGEHPSEIVLWKRGHLRIVGRPKDAYFAVSNAINDRGVIVGGAIYNLGDMLQPLAWRRGKFTNLPLPPGAFGGGANDINELGQIVGWLKISTSVGIAGGVWINEIPYDLNTLILGNDDGEYVVSAYKINDKGQILVGIGGGFNALLIPVDSPPGDIDKNCIVNVTDLLLLLGEFGSEDSYADVDVDGDVDVLDLIQLLRNFGESNVP